MQTLLQQLIDYGILDSVVDASRATRMKLLTIDNQNMTMEDLEQTGTINCVQLGRNSSWVIEKGREDYPDRALYTGRVNPSDKVIPYELGMGAHGEYIHDHTEIMKEPHTSTRITDEMVTKLTGPQLINKEWMVVGQESNVNDQFKPDQVICIVYVADFNNYLYTFTC